MFDFIFYLILKVNWMEEVGTTSATASLIIVTPPKEFHYRGSFIIHSGWGHLESRNTWTTNPAAYVAPWGGGGSINREMNSNDKDDQ